MLVVLELLMKGELKQQSRCTTVLVTCACNANGHGVDSTANAMVLAELCHCPYVFIGGSRFFGPTTASTICLMIHGLCDVPLLRAIVKAAAHDGLSLHGRATRTTHKSRVLSVLNPGARQGLFAGQH